MGFLLCVPMRPPSVVFLLVPIGGLFAFSNSTLKSPCGPFFPSSAAFACKAASWLVNVAQADTRSSPGDVGRSPHCIKSPAKSKRDLTSRSVVLPGKPLMTMLATGQSRRLFMAIWAESSLYSVIMRSRICAL